MASNLLIVESPAKAKTIRKFLGRDFEVKASVGHIRDLPVSKLGVDVADGFKPSYETTKGKEKVIQDLQKAAAKAKAVFLGPDPDREGEAIAWHIREALSQDGPAKEFHRVLFHEITKEAVQKALSEPLPIDQEKFESQQARRILDRLVGYSISPLLWDKVRRGLSAGRVQSVALRLIVEREREIWAFKPEEFWSLTALLAGAEPPEFEAKLLKIKARKAEVRTEAEAGEIVAALTGKGAPAFQVEKITRRTVRQNPAPPFITSTLQQEAFNKLGYPAARTMRLAQRLYEGVEIGDEGGVGLITYMRTDSFRVIPQAQQAVREYIAKTFGQDYVPPKPPVHKAPKAAQEAHEAIRPTSVLRHPDQMAAFLDKDLNTLYRLIWQRFVASQMAPAVIDQTSVDIQAGEFTFRASGSKIQFEGFRKLSPNDDKDENLLPALAQGQELNLRELTPKQHFTQPPPRYTDASLVKEMEEKGIGRPSTYAAILSTLQDKEYVLREKGRFRPTDLGLVVTDLLVASFPDLLDAGFTAQMEENLDRIEEGKAGWQETLSQFYGPFSQTLAQAKKNMASLKGQGVATDIPCPTCGQPMVVKLGKAGQFLACPNYPDCKTTMDFTRTEEGKIVPAEKKALAVECPVCGKPMMEKKGRFGPFLACTGYPECKTTKPLSGDKEKPKEEPTEEICDKCGRPMVIKTARRGGGRFLACTGYPKCKNAKPIPTGVACPEPNCTGALAERTSKRGKVFYGCTRYPECSYVIYNKPVPKACPKCGHPFLVEKQLKAGQTLACPAKGCNHKEPAEGEKSES